MSKHEIILAKPLLPVYFDIYNSSYSIVPNHWHTHIEVILILQGQMQVICNQNNLLLNSNDLMIINSTDIHYTKSIGNTKVLLLQIPYEYLKNALPDLSQITFQSYMPNRTFQKNEAYQELLHALHSMKDVYEQKEDGYPFLFCQWLQTFLYTLYTQFSTRQNGISVATDTKANERMRNIITYIEEHYMEQLTLQGVSGIFALNPEYFCRYFKKQIGFSFLKYVNLVRISHIVHDLTYTEDAIIDILNRHGFTNHKLFYQLFKETYHTTPTAIRKQKHS
ncbi:helix-turn-helix domain-containing protein [Anaerosporobacter faecicola]|uniref:helix-turn-helix domain-containing protein n=1 Tax=Anaerosporobacter faecicola TaxID=2718714 RepID=UPI001438D072|nr:AraC family transcriptional regulator [Anaerosporobacter faecicola]